MDNLQTLQTLLQLGWPAIVLIECFVLYRDNIKMRDLLVSYLNDCRKQENPTTIVKSEVGSD